MQQIDRQPTLERLPNLGKPKRVLNTLLALADARGYVRWQTKAAIAARAGCTESGVRQVVQKLEQRGYLKRVTSRGGAGVANTYRLQRRSTRNN